jgi:hypothetical protein
MKRKRKLSSIGPKGGVLVLRAWAGEAIRIVVTTTE